MSSAPDASNTADARQGLGAMTVRGAVFLGVGSMVGAGIFALLGEAGAVAGAAVWLSFLIAGIVATLQGYAIAKLGARYPSSGGIVTFLIQGFGKGHLTAITSWLLHFAALIVTAMVPVSFGSLQSPACFADVRPARQGRRNTWPSDLRPRRAGPRDLRQPDRNRLTGQCRRAGHLFITSIAAYRLRAETGSRASVLITGILLTVVVLLVFAVQTLRTEPLTFVPIIAIVGLAIILDLIWSRIRARRAAAAG
jgi:amino acid transporter